MTSYAELDRLRKLARPLYLELRALDLDIIVHENPDTQSGYRIDLVGACSLSPAHLDRLQRRVDEATAQIQRAEVRFSELEERRAVLSPKTFSGDEEATAELEEVEDEHDQLARSVRVARSAVPEFEKMLAEARARAAEARTDIHRERYQALTAEGDALTPKIEELGRELNELLEKRAALYHDAAQELRYYDGDGANALSMGVRPAVQDFIDGTFYRWLH